MEHRHTFGIVAGAAAVLVVAGSLTLPIARAQTSRRPAPPPPTAADCRQVMAEMEILQSEMLSLDQAICAKTELMYVGEVTERLDAVTAVLEELIEQRRVMLGHMKGAHQKMIVHIMRHMAASDTDDALGALDTCPVMRSLHGDQPTAAGTR